MTALSRRGLLGGTAAITASVLAGAPARAAAPMAGKQNASFYRYKVGDFEVTALNEGAVRNATPQNMRSTRRFRTSRRRSAMRSCRPTMSSTSSTSWS